QPAVGVLSQQLLRQTGRLAAEHEIIARGKSRLCVKPRPAGLNEPELRRGSEALLKRGPVHPTMPFNVLPVIQPRSFELFVVQLEAEGFDEVQRGPGRRAEPCHVARVGWN